MWGGLVPCADRECGEDGCGMGGFWADLKQWGKILKTNISRIKQRGGLHCRTAVGQLSRTAVGQFFLLMFKFQP